MKKDIAVRRLMFVMWIWKERDKKEKKRKRQLFNAQSKERILSSDQLFQSIYSSFPVNLAVVICRHSRRCNDEKKTKKRRKRTRMIRKRSNRERENVIFLIYFNITKRREREKMIRSSLVHIVLCRAQLRQITWGFA